MLCTDTKASLTHFTCGALEFWICTVTGPTFTGSSSIADLPIRRHTRQGIQRAITCAASEVGETLAHSAFADTVSCVLERYHSEMKSNIKHKICDCKTNFHHLRMDTGKRKHWWCNNEFRVENKFLAPQKTTYRHLTPFPILHLDFLL